ncbi:PREDICTED: bcl-2-interacting killer isoform X1 [Condylura cristata]|uniref:bcl-2-interacting killer isoform X1 n=1 Tax=Condylura cristata TaxID=143302 RepID=UPI000643A31A|nr:PREDICTED: bcl-2-interacting killer isoform X1 [Condylura cristata]
MSRGGPVSRNLFLDSLLYEQAPGAAGVPGMTHIMESSDPESSPGRDSIPDDVAMRLAFIGDEMDVRWTLPHIAELPRMAVHSLTFTYSQAGLRGVLRSFISGLVNLRENRRFWSFLIFRDRVPPNLGRELALSVVLLLLCWGLCALQ